MTQGLPNRQDISSTETWDLKDLFQNDKDFYQTLDEMITSSLSFHERYNGQLTEIDTIERALKDYEALLIQIDRLGNYAELRLSVDTTDEAAQTLNAKLNTSYGKIASRLSFVESEILNLNNDTLQQLKSQTQYPHYIQQLIVRKPYQLDPKVEQTLASLSPTLNQPYDLYGTTKMLDIAFESFKHNLSLIHI